MARRLRSSEQSTHDTVVRKIADTLNDDGWTVEADHVDSYDQPDSINGYIPDIYAVKASGLRSLVVEVETGTSDDEDQRAAFKKWSRENVLRTYQGILAKSKYRWETFEEV